ncbi:rRNA (cytidine-2'-O-)-methyltransferase [Oleiphilus sp. HI0078]|uniref:16S rRNA (cytidine(1402)-2'-O)-methyltransferase n=1 Tax=unclassified Oleiphilus TaxID=2631174 RepID=UPI0007C2A4A2|nr:MULTISPECIES: 16S rRNA (cytidine(1402)-2'-O)-methyltransferase [unclassified Oleiphilus]KZY39356.1 rRNA (cytidine-2'-O-)-methyltransferase [Oleiphilus sp. HI0043]KZY84867.1 rRNA (cytidine-2'-O-)-methyltransferase [Oleiphilus sp. HI0072]KZZ21517.1 rRNA (cytidine-2'-O-)-methyltransferase [Oleiphilus sp. HI0078]KZZ67926.1 rRNA (cytidine-2'-O-)-methyltransferase [Oleiphilus sp. HI0128]
MESAIYIVATPIGNLSDITLRAIEVLKAVDVVAAEDTRHTRKLLEHYGIATKMISLHEHNESEKSAYIIGLVKEGQSVALVSDAGTPLISDPGYTLVLRAKESGVLVRPIPGASALIAALCASGVASDTFIFEGFLPAKKKAKEEVLQSYLAERRTVIFYESPHRILVTLEAMSDVLAGRKLCVARELTKRYETIKYGEVSEVLAWMKADEDQTRGEFVLVLEGSQEEPLSVSDEQKLKLLARLLLELPPKKASAVVADVVGGSKKEIYNLALSLKEK